jgi:hypothetical protein
MPRCTSLSYKLVQRRRGELCVSRWLGFWLDHLAVVQARFTARAVYNRACACKDAANAPFRARQLVDVDNANAPPRSAPPQPLPSPLKSPPFYARVK